MHLCLAFVLALISLTHTTAFSDADASALSNIHSTLLQHPRRRGRALQAQQVAENDGACTWDADQSECRVSKAATADHLAASDSPYAQFLSGFAACEAAAVDEETCNAVGTCLWDPHTSRCIRAAFDVGYEDSPCVVNASATIQSLIASEQCAAHLTQMSCFMDPNCDWDQEYLECSDNGFKFYFGISLEDISRAADGVIQYKAAILREQFPLYFNITDPDFDWSDVLDWDMPATDCPIWSDPLICIFVDGILQNIAVGFYCRGKYAFPVQFRDCIRDPLCEFRLETASCRAPHASYAPGARAGLRGMIAASAKPVDKELMFKTLECNEIMDPDKCEGTDGCTWDANDEDGTRCEIRGDRIARILAAPGQNSTDPVCTHASALADSGCLDLADIYGPAACIDNPNCELEIDGDCTATVDYLMTVALQQDAALRASYRLLEMECAAYQSKRSCQSAVSTYTNS